MTQPSTDSDLWSFSQVADAYLAMHRIGSAPTVQELAESFPHLASEIHDKLPAMQLLEGAIGQRLEDNSYPNVDINKPIGGCHVIEEIGRGACGIVYRASQPELNREVAIKAIRLQANTTKRFEVERHAMARLNHPNIVPVYAYTQVDEQAYLIMKLIEGFSFEQLVRGDCDHHGKVQLSELRSDWGRFAEISRDIAAGLEHAHEHNLVHRDIKPGNLMLDRKGQVWIADFGLVKLLDLSQSLSATGDLIGTPRYMSPEQLRGTCDARSDIYSFGLSLRELATGQRPRQFHDVAETNATNGIGSAVPPALLHIIEKASAISPEDRFQSAKELRLVLQRFIDGLVPDRRRSRRKPDDVFLREFRTKISLATLGAALIGALSYFFFFRAAGETVPTEVRAPMPDRREFKLLEQESRAIESGLDDLLRGIETGKLTDEHITQVARRYRESRLSIAARTVRIAAIFGKSNLPMEDKKRGCDAASKLAQLVAFEQIDEQTASEIVNELTDGRAYTKEEFEQLTFDDERLLRWTKSVNSKTGDIEVVKKDLTDDVKEIFSVIQIPDSKTTSKKGTTRAQSQTTKAKGNERPKITVSRKRIDDAIKKLPKDLRQRALEELKRRSK